MWISDTKMLNCISIEILLEQMSLGLGFRLVFNRILFSTNHSRQCCRLEMDHASVPTTSAQNKEKK